MGKHTTFPIKKREALDDGSVYKLVFDIRMRHVTMTLNFAPIHQVFLQELTQENLKHLLLLDVPLIRDASKQLPQSLSYPHIHLVQAMLPLYYSIFLKHLTPAGFASTIFVSYQTACGSHQQSISI
jgi:hypothetical protein